MKKTRWMMLFLATVWMSLLLGNTVMANIDYRVLDIKPDTAVDLKSYMTFEDTYDEKTGKSVYTTVYNEYKLVIPDDGYITVNMQGADDLHITGFKHNKAYYASKGQREIPILFSLNYEDFQKGQNAISLGKGTYYFSSYFSGDDTETRPFSYSFKKAVFPANYCRVKAQTLKKGRKAEICQVPKKNYSRWFKIKLTKKQKITFWSDHGNFVSIFNEDLRHISIKRPEENSIKYSTDQKLPKGTYYLRMARSSNLYPDDCQGYYYTTLFWK